MQAVLKVKIQRTPKVQITLAIREILEIPENYKVVILLPLGFPAGKPGPKIRKTIEEIVSFEKFKE